MGFNMKDHGMLRHMGYFLRSKFLDPNESPMKFIPSRDDPLGTRFSVASCIRSLDTIGKLPLMSTRNWNMFLIYIIDIPNDDILDVIG